MLHALPSITQHILCEETDLAQLKQKPLHFKCGIYLICTHGQALISTGVQQYVFEEQTELIFLTGSLIQVFSLRTTLRHVSLCFRKKSS